MPQPGSPPHSALHGSHAQPPGPAFPPEAPRQPPPASHQPPDQPQHPPAPPAYPTIGGMGGAGSLGHQPAGAPLPTPSRSEQPAAEHGASGGGPLPRCLLSSLGHKSLCTAQPCATRRLPCTKAPAVPADMSGLHWPVHAREAIVHAVSLGWDDRCLRCCQPVQQQVVLQPGQVACQASSPPWPPSPRHKSRQSMLPARCPLRMWPTRASSCSRPSSCCQSRQCRLSVGMLSAESSNTSKISSM